MHSDVAHRRELQKESVHTSTYSRAYHKGCVQSFVYGTEPQMARNH